MKKTIGYCTAVLSMMVIGAQTNAQPTMTAEQAINHSKSVVPGNNQFANNLLAGFVAAQDKNAGNVFFSPISIAAVLALAGEGAKGQTAMEIQRTFGLPKTDNDRRLGFQGLFAAIHQPDAGYQLLTANALWLQKDYKLTSDFTTVAQTDYGATAQNVDFKLKPDAALQTINDWVANNTNQRINGLLGKADITDKTRLILTNTIYFKGDWLNEFTAGATQPGDFTTANGVVQAPLMHLQKNFSYYATADAQVLAMPYKGNELSMMVVLPKPGVTIAKLATVKNLATLLGNNDDGSVLVNVTFPKFRFETKYDMNGPLGKLGIKTAFGNAADFSGISGKKDLSISKVIHQTFIEVTETGTEAAAATGGVMHAGAAFQRPKEPVTFNADHPFVFAIRHNATGAILFVGVVNNPNGK